MKPSLLWIIVLMAVVGGCAGNSQKVDMPVRPTIRIKGSDTMLILAKRWAEVFMQRNPRISIYVDGGGSRAGIRALIDGKVDIATSSRPLQPEEVKAMMEEKGTLVTSVITARDALSIYLHPSNPVSDLSLVQLRDLFSGAITNWQELGGLDLPVRLYSRNPNSGTYLFFEEHVLNGQAYAKTAKTLPTTRAIIAAVREDPGGIGYGGMAYSVDVQQARIEGAEPNDQTVRNGAYPISRYLFLCLAEAPTGALKRFTDWILGPTGQAIVAEIGYIPLYGA